MTTKEMSIPEHAQTARDFLAASDREFAAGDHLHPGLRQTPGKSPPEAPAPMTSTSATSRCLPINTAP